MIKSETSQYLFQKEVLSLLAELTSDGGSCGQEQEREKTKMSSCGRTDGVLNESFLEGKITRLLTLFRVHGFTRTRMMVLCNDFPIDCY